MGSTYLTKSAFKIGRRCPTRLYYYRSGYPSTMQEDPYLQFLAEGGHIVGKIAQLLYPGGILIDSSAGLEQAVLKTEEELKKQDVILFEAALRAGNKLVLVDVLEKRGRSVKLIEVKSKSYDGEKDRELQEKGRTLFINTKGGIDSDWVEYLEDICYQEYVARLAHPEFKYVPYLLMPDKAKTTSIENLSSMFEVREDPIPGSNKTRLAVHFNGNAEQIRNDNFLTLRKVEEEISILRGEVELSAELLDKTLTPLTRSQTPITINCAKCDYNTGEKNGFLECWGHLGEVKPHIFDLYFGIAIQKGELFDSLIRAQKVSLFDVPLAGLSGKRGVRQEIQIENSKHNREWVSDELLSTLKNVKYPLHFVDFETSRVAVPYHAGMRPYEQVAFQWSCHTICEPGGVPSHSEWINVENRFPNFEFARKLREQVGDTGTVLTWAHHENTTLKDISSQMDKYGKDDPELKEWLLATTSEKSGRILDLNKVTLECFFHPDMKGRTSLKYVLPAVWNNHRELHDIPWLKKYVSYDRDDAMINPYKVLAEIDIAGKAEVVEEGTGAMRAYEDMLFGKVRDDPATKEKWKNLLLQYCELDTMAMVIVWIYWNKAVGLHHWL